MYSWPSSSFGVLSTYNFLTLFAEAQVENTVVGDIYIKLKYLEGAYRLSLITYTSFLNFVGFNASILFYVALPLDWFNFGMGPLLNGPPLPIFAYVTLIYVILCATVQGKLKIKVLVCGVQNKIVCGSVKLARKLFDLFYLFKLFIHIIIFFF